MRLHGLFHDPMAFGGCYAEESLLTETEFAVYITEPPTQSAIFGAFLADEMVGVVGLRVSSIAKMRHKATLWGMYTLPEARGHGIGRGLMNCLLAYARSQKPELERILLAVTASNKVASNWYASLGFQLYGIEQNAVKFGASYEDDELRVLEL